MGKKSYFFVFLFVGIAFTAALAPGTKASSVLEFHNSPKRSGLYTDSSLSRDKVSTMNPNPSSSVSMSGPIYAQPLYLESIAGNKDLVILTTEQNEVIAIDPNTSSVVWSKKLGTAPPLSSFECGNIDPLGITGTPVIDSDSKTLFVDAMITPDGGKTKTHQVFALSVIDGSIRSGWPVDIGKGLASQSKSFQSQYQNQRGALALVKGTLYIPFGGLYGDCGDYNGWLVGISISNPKSIQAWSTKASKGGIWSPSGVASDGSNLFIGTGNTEGASSWSGGEAVIRLQPGPTFTQNSTNYFAPSDWQTLDQTDRDIGSGGPILINLSSPSSTELVAELGKNGFLYLLDKNNLGGIGGALVQKQVSKQALISSPVFYTSEQASYIAFKGSGSDCPQLSSGDLMAIQLKGFPPTIQTAWCAFQNGLGSPIVSTTDGTHEAIVWGLGSENGNQLTAFDGTTGEILFKSTPLATVRRYQTPIINKGKLFVAAENKLYIFKMTN